MSRCDKLKRQETGTISPEQTTPCRWHLPTSCVTEQQSKDMSLGMGPSVEGDPHIWQMPARSFIETGNLIWVPKTLLNVSVIMFWDVPWLCHTELAPLGTPAAAQSVGGQLRLHTGDIWAFKAEDRVVTVNISPPYTPLLDWGDIPGPQPPRVMCPSDKVTVALLELGSSERRPHTWVCWH